MPIMKRQMQSDPFVEINSLIRGENLATARTVKLPHSCWCSL